MAAARALRPKGLGDILDETIRIYRTGFITLLGTMAVLMLPLAILMLPAIFATVTSFAERERPDVTALIALGLTGALTTIVFSLGIILAGGAVTHVAADILLGRATGVKPGYVSALGRVWALLGAVLLFLVAEVGLVLVSVPLLVTMVIGWLAVPIGLIVWAVSPRSRRPWLKWLIILTTPFGLAIYLGVLWALYAQAIILERLGPRAGLGRSRALVQGQWWRVFGILILVSILISILESIPSALFSLVGVLVVTGGDLNPTSALAFRQALSNLGTALGAILFGSLTFIAMTVLYLDLRVRKEAFDLELMAAQLGPSDAPDLP